MSGLLNAVRDAFAINQWSFDEVPGHEVIRAQFEAHHTRVPVHVQVFEPIHAIHVVATSPHQFEDFHLLKLSELLLRSSEQLTIGNFEMRWDEKQVLFRCANLFDEGDPFPAKLLHAMVHAAIAEMDRITPLLAEVQSKDAAGTALIHIPQLLAREDWLPPIPEAEASSG